MRQIRKVDQKLTQTRLDVIGTVWYPDDRRVVFTQLSLEDTHMKIWTKPAVREQEVGLEVTSYLPAEIDLI
jgi:coenzyme PQQ precursor peptide PqqA